MNCSTHKPAPAASKQAWLKKSVLVGLSIVVLTLMIVVLLRSTGMMISVTSGHVLASFIYSTLIALPSMFLLNGLARVYAERWPRGFYVICAVALLATALFGCLVGAWVQVLIRITEPAHYWDEVRSSFSFAALMALVIGLSTTRFEIMRDSLSAAQNELHQKQMEQERANKLLVEARLSSLESRLQPHFLFNTLNSIAALIPSDPQRAEATVGKLASLLRFSLNAQQQGLVALEQELKIVRDYLEIEQTRFGTRLRSSIQIDASLNSIQLPPLTIQTLVENVIKHVVARRSEGAMIELRATRVADALQIDVIDDGPGFRLDEASSDHGLGNLAARLELQFGAQGHLDVSTANGKTTVRVTVPA